jgi:hypothetical protein
MGNRNMTRETMRSKPLAQDCVRRRDFCRHGKEILNSTKNKNSLIRSAAVNFPAFEVLELKSYFNQLFIKIKIAYHDNLKFWKLIFRNVCSASPIFEVYFSVLSVHNQICISEIFGFPSSLKCEVLTSFSATFRLN